MSKEKKLALVSYYALRIKKGKLTEGEVLEKYPEIEEELYTALTEVM